MRVQVLSDFPRRFSPGVELLLEGRSLLVQRVHWSRGDAIIAVREVTTRDDAEALSDKLLQVPESHLQDLPEGQYYHYHLMDMEVWTVQGEYLGRVEDILVTGSNDVLVVRHQGREVLIPAIEDVLAEVDVAGKRMTVDLPEGLQ